MKYLKYVLYFLLLLVLIFFGRGLLTPSIEYTSEITVNKSAAESWAVMGDEESMPDWIDGFKRIELVSGTPNTVGAVSNIYVEDGGKEMMMVEEITAFEPEEKMAMNFNMDFMEMDYELLLNEKDGETTISSTSITRGNGIFAKSLFSFMQGSMKKQEDKNLNKLKILIEENTNDYMQQPELIQVDQDSI